MFCGSKRYEHEAAYLAEIAKKVYLFPAYKDVDLKAENVEIVSGAIREVAGEQRVSAVRLADGSEIAVDGFFCLRNAIAPSTLLPGLALDGPHIVTDRTMATNIPGCYAAGDCTGRPYQIAKAVGEGNVAAHAMLDELAEAQ